MTFHDALQVCDAGMVLEEQPAKVAEAMKLFLQGLGHSITLARWGACLPSSAIMLILI